MNTNTNTRSNRYFEEPVALIGHGGFCEEFIVKFLITHEKER